MTEKQEIRYNRIGHPNTSYNNWTEVELDIDALKAKLEEVEPGISPAFEDITGDPNDNEALKEELDGIKEDIENKQDKEEGKGLSTNDYDDTEKAQVAQNKEDIEQLQSDIEGKVDKEDGKGLSSNDFTDGYKTQISDNTNRIGDAEGRITANEEAIQGHTETLDTHEDAIQQAQDDIEDLKGKQDPISPGRGIHIQDQVVSVKIDGTTIKVNDEGNLYTPNQGGGQGGGVSAGAGISVSGNQVSVNIDGVTTRVNSNNQLVAIGSGEGFIDGGVADSEYLSSDIIDGGSAYTNFI